MLPATPKQVALQMADLVRRRFAAEVFEAGQGTMNCTASAGVAVAESAPPAFNAVPLPIRAVVLLFATAMLIAPPTPTPRACERTCAPR